MTDPNITDQTIIAAVAYHLLCQGERSTDGQGYCCYYSDTGAKCAVGALIPQELYNPSLEGWGISREPMSSVLEVLGLRTHVRVLYILQNIHDSGYPQVWPSMLRALAEEYGCDFTI